MKLYMFRTVPLYIIRSFSLYTQQWYMSYRFADSLRAASGWSCSKYPLACASRWEYRLVPCMYGKESIGRFFPANYLLL